LIVVSHSPAETETLGRSWGESAQAGLVIALSGPLGAGKTQLVKGLAQGLGFQGRIHSPTFTIVNVYTGGRLTLFHLDLFRLDTPDQIQAAGIEEYLHPAGVAVIEWAEKWPALNFSPQRLPCSIQNPRFIRAQIEVQSETERRIIYEDFGD